MLCVHVQAALQLLLAKETRLLHTLDKLRVAATQEKRATGRQKVLGALAQPKTWPLSNGKKVRCAGAPASSCLPVYRCAALNRCLPV
jgi:hypothetical protein